MIVPSEWRPPSRPARAAARRSARRPSLKARLIDTLASKWEQCSMSRAAWRNRLADRNQEGGASTRKECTEPAVPNGEEVIANVLSLVYSTCLSFVRQEIEEATLCETNASSPP